MKNILICLLAVCFSTGCVSKWRAKKAEPAANANQPGSGDRQPLVAKARAGEPLTLRQWQQVLLFDSSYATEFKPMTAREVAALLGRPDRVHFGGTTAEYSGRLVNESTGQRASLIIRFNSERQVHGINNWGAR